MSILFSDEKLTMLNRKCICFWWLRLHSERFPGYNKKIALWAVLRRTFLLGLPPEPFELLGANEKIKISDLCYIFLLLKTKSTSPQKNFICYSSMSISNSTELLIRVTLVSHVTLILTMADLIDSYRFLCYS